MGDQTGNDKTGDKGQETVSKADLDAKVVELDKAKQELEDMRLEVFSPEYMEFLDSKDKGGDKKDESKKETHDEKVDFSKMTPEQIYQKAREDAAKDAEERAKVSLKETLSASEKEAKAREVAAFARGHEDFETFRPIMYGLSLDPKNKDLTLGELYEASKAYIKRHSEPSKEEKERQARMSTEKPGGDNESYEKYRKMSPEDTAKDSLKEVKEKFGPIPGA